jgi:hypothetical protein
MEILVFCKLSLVDIFYIKKQKTLIGYYFDVIVHASIFIYKLLAFSLLL